MIASFADKVTEDLYHGETTARVRRLPADVVPAALRKLDMLEAAHVLNDLAVPPGNRLETLKGTRKGLHSVRVNDQWRIVFRWLDGAAGDVRLTDYH